MSRPTLILDLEVYRNYFLAAFRNVATGNVRHFEAFEGQALDLQSLRAILTRYQIITFNGTHFDLPLLSFALAGARCDQIKRACDAIIHNDLRSWQLEKQFAFKIVPTDHIDLIEVAPGTASLKTYAGRLHAHRMQDLPIEPNASIEPEDRELLRTYCTNDLVNTQALYTKLLPQIELRERMSADYGIDLRSKSDAQIAEAVIGREVERMLRKDIEQPEFPPDTEFCYKAPDFIRFSTDSLRQLLDGIQQARFVVPDTGKVALPSELTAATIQLGASEYRLGIGGLHSCEQSTAHVADQNTVLVDRDVTSYYPSIILRCELAPAHMGRAFTKVYQDLVTRRLQAKRDSDKVTADALKITLNGSFGKFGSKWSKLYSPDLLIQTTITGQLCLLMLIEALESEGIPVVSANTDGIVIKCPADKVVMMDFVVWEWEQITGFSTEDTHYRALYSRDVNNYIAVKTDGGVKLKGAYAPAGLQKNPTNEICTAAVVKHLIDGTPIEDTIRGCTDVRRFVTIRQVKGGALDQDGNYLGKAVRWYYARGGSGALTYRLNGHIVPRSEGSRALMQLPEQFPCDVDHDWYLREANSILGDIGADAMCDPAFGLDHA